MTHRLTPIDQANLMAGHAVSYATSFLDGRSDASQLADNAVKLFLDLLVIETPETGSFLIPVQLLAVAMMRTAKHASTMALHIEARQQRWEAVMASLVELVIHESRQLAGRVEP